MPAESRQTEKRVISDKKILSKKTRDRHWRSCCGLTYKQKHFFGLYGKSIGRKYLQWQFFWCCRYNLLGESIYNSDFRLLWMNFIVRKYL